MIRRAEYTQLLTPAERLACIKFGAAATYLLAGTGLTKEGQIPSPGEFAKGMGGLIVALSLIGGGPLGAIAHHIDRKRKADTPTERERLRKIQYYKDITRQFEHGLANS